MSSDKGTRKSSCVTARGVLPAAQQVRILLYCIYGYLGIWVVPQSEPEGTPQSQLRPGKEPLELGNSPPPVDGCNYHADKPRAMLCGSRFRLQLFTTWKREIASIVYLLTTNLTESPKKGCSEGESQCPEEVQWSTGNKQCQCWKHGLCKRPECNYNNSKWIHFISLRNGILLAYAVIIGTFRAKFQKRK